MSQIRRYVNNIIVQSTSKTISPEGNANSISFLNQGASIAIVQGVRLQPYQSMSLEGNDNEIDMSTYTIDFEPKTGLLNQLVIVRKSFL